ncbi:MAG: hypothetical protein M1347_02515 [Chloroflexi bacterium]|nr:hypothetical protein [Chloroflexota bacterium]
MPARSRKEKIDGERSSPRRLPRLQQSYDLGDFVNSKSAILDEMGSRINKFANSYVHALIKKKVKMSVMEISYQDYFVAKFPLIEPESFSHILVSITRDGKDLIIERRRYLKIKRGYGCIAIIIMGVMVVFTYGLALLLLLIQPFRHWLYQLDKSKSYTDQFNRALKHELIVLNALKEALKVSGGSKEMIPYL